MAREPREEMTHWNGNENRGNGVAAKASVIPPVITGLLDKLADMFKRR
jgi:hypothetical protein